MIKVEKKIWKLILISVLLFSLSAQLGFAKTTCTYNGKEIPCSEMPKWFLIIPVVLGGLGLIIGLLSFIFWLWMLIDAINHQKEDKTMWVLVIIFLSILGATIYYFSEKRKRKKSKKK